MNKVTYQLIHGDCLEEMPKLPDQSVDAIIADIPYDEVNRSSNGLRSIDKGSADVLTFDLTVMMDEIKRLSRCFHLFCATEQVSRIRETAVIDKWSTRLFIWEKTNPSPMNGQYIWLSGIECSVFGKRDGATFNEFCANPVWRGPNVYEPLHPTQKPVALMSYLIRTYTNPGDTVLDFTCGSGSTGVAAVQNGRHFIGIDNGYCEKEGPYYGWRWVDVARERIANAAGDFVQTEKEKHTGQMSLFDRVTNG